VGIDYHDRFRTTPVIILCLRYYLGCDSLSRDGERSGYKDQKMQRSDQSDWLWIPRKRRRWTHWSQAWSFRVLSGGIVANAILSASGWRYTRTGIYRPCGTVDGQWSRGNTGLMKGRVSGLSDMPLKGYAMNYYSPVRFPLILRRTTTERGTHSWRICKGSTFCPFSVLLSPSCYYTFIYPLLSATFFTFSALSRRSLSPVNQLRHSVSVKSELGRSTWNFHPATLWQHQHRNVLKSTSIRTRYRS
jgi:hypothetical protein